MGNLYRKCKLRYGLWPKIDQRLIMVGTVDIMISSLNRQQAVISRRFPDSTQPEVTRALPEIARVLRKIDRFADMSNLMRHFVR